MTQVADDQRFRSRENVSGDYVQTLLNSLTLDQIRDAAYLLAPAAKITIRSHALSREGIAQTHRSNQEIASQLLKIEAAQPFKHCLFFSCPSAVDFSNVTKQVSSSVAAKGLDFRIAYVHETDKVYVVTFEHSVSVKEWVQDSNEEVKRLTTVQTRHPVVLRVIKSTGLGSLNYPGFSQGQGTKREHILQYPSVLEGVLQVVGGLGFSPRVLSVKESLKVLLTGGNARVHRFRADVEAAGVGRFDLASSRRDVTVEDSLASLLKLEDGEGRTQFIEAARKALNEADTNSTVLYWTEERIITRLRFWEVGCELLFVWLGERQSYEAVDEIVELLAGAHERIGPWIGNQKNVPLQWIASLAQGTIVKPHQLAEALNLPPASARSELIYAVKAGLLLPVYRLNTNELIVELENGWTDRISDLRRLFITDAGQPIDGRDPSLVEVAFKRVGDAGESGN